MYRTLSRSIHLEAHTCLLAVREALAAAIRVFFHDEPRFTMMAWYASVCTCSRVNGRSPTVVLR